MMATNDPTSHSCGSIPLLGYMLVGATFRCTGNIILFNIILLFPFANPQLLSQIGMEQYPNCISERLKFTLESSL